MSRILIGNVRDKLVNNLLATKAGTGALDAAQGKVLKDLVESVLGQQADVYSKKTYAVGDYCIYENALYKCSTAISSAEDWTAGHWAKTTIAAELKNIVGSVAAINGAITELNGNLSNNVMMDRGRIPLENGILDLNSVRADNGYKPGIYASNGEKLYINNTFYNDGNGFWGILVLYPVYDRQVIYMHEYIYTRARIGAPAQWTDWVKLSP